MKRCGRHHGRGRKVEALPSPIAISSPSQENKTRGVIAGLVRAISIRMAQYPIIGMAGTSLDEPGHDGHLRVFFSRAQPLDSTLFFGGISFCQNGTG
jgi:hypothetical protein